MLFLKMSLKINEKQTAKGTLLTYHNIELKNLGEDFGKSELSLRASLSTGQGTSGMIRTESLQANISKKEFFLFSGCILMAMQLPCVSVFCDFYFYLFLLLV